MAQTQAHMKATNKYIAKTYDQVKFLVPKGQREAIRAHAEEQGMSLNAYINSLIAADMEQDKHDTQTEHQSEHQTESTTNPHKTEGYTVVIPEKKVKRYKEYAENNNFETIEECVLFEMDDIILIGKE